MNKSQRIVLNIMISLVLVVIVFHLLVFAQIIPYTIVWAGKLNSVTEMRLFELMSISLSLVLLTTLILKGNYLKHHISFKIINGILWLHVLLFSLNTLGNLAAKTIFEKAVFTPLTALSVILLLIILLKRKK